MKNFAENSELQNKCEELAAAAELLVEAPEDNKPFYFRKLAQSLIELNEVKYNLLASSSTSRSGSAQDKDN